MSYKPIFRNIFPYSAFVRPILITKLCGYPAPFRETERKHTPERKRKPERAHLQLNFRDTERKRKPRKRNERKRKPERADPQPWVGDGLAQVCVSAPCHGRELEIHTAWL